MGKTKKANYNKAKTTEVQVVQVTNNEEDGNSYTIYSLDKDQRWNLYNDIESFQKDPHEERKSRLDRIQENKDKKKKEFIKNMNVHSYNNRKITSDLKMNPYNSKKGWHGATNPRFKLPEEVYDRSDDDEEEVPQEEEDEELQEDEYKVHKIKHGKAKIFEDSEEEEEDEEISEESEEEFEEGTHVIVTTKIPSKPVKNQKKKKGNKGNKHKETF